MPLKVCALLLLGWMPAPLWGADASAANGSSTARGRIVILGDSLTAGYGIDPAHAYPALLQQKIDAAGLPYTIINAGVSGDTTAGGLQRLSWVLKGGAEVLVIALGANDGLRGLPTTQTAQNLTQIITKARARLPQLRVIVVGMKMPPSMGAKFAADFQAIFPAVAGQTHSELVPFLLEGVGGIAALNQADGLHPTVEGHVKLAENVWPVLEKVLRKSAAK